MMDDEFVLYDLIVEVVGNEEDFVCSHKVGPAFRVRGENLIFDSQQEFSMYSLAALLPLLPAKQRPLDANDWMLTDMLITCPDPHCKAQFKISRSQQSVFRHSEATRVPLRKEEQLCKQKEFN